MTPFSFHLEGNRKLRNCCSILENQDILVQFMIDSIFIDLRLLQIPRSISTDTDISKSARVGCSHVEELNSQQNIFNVDRHFFCVWPAFHQTVAARSQSLRQVWRVWRRIKSGSLLLVPLYKCHKMISCAIHFVKLFTGNVSRWLRDCKLISLNYKNDRRHTKDKKVFIHLILRRIHDNKEDIYNIHDLYSLIVCLTAMTNRLIWTLNRLEMTEIELLLQNDILNLLLERLQLGISKDNDITPNHGTLWQQNRNAFQLEHFLQIYLCSPSWYLVSLQAFRKFKLWRKCHKNFLTMDQLSFLNIWGNAF